jgi:hypothetical protein
MLHTDTSSDGKCVSVHLQRQRLWDTYNGLRLMLVSGAEVLERLSQPVSSQSSCRSERALQRDLELTRSELATMAACAPVLRTLHSLHSFRAKSCAATIHG